MPSKKEKLPLSVTHPELAKEADGWDPTTVFPWSSKKYAWKCELMHQYFATPAHRSFNKSGCPFCSGNKVLIGFNDLLTTHPELANEVDGWDPKTLSKGSGRKVKWICSSAHSWTATVASRATGGNSCPYCGRKKVLKGFNDLATTHPQIAVQAYGWDPSAVVSGNSKMLEWKCSIGHIWKSSPSTRSFNKSGCPVCIGRQVREGFNDLASTHPQLALEMYEDFSHKYSAGSHNKVKWICQKGHVYSASIRSRALRNTGCGICSGNQSERYVNDLATTHPLIADEAYQWDPSTLSAGSGKKRQWKCKKGHIYLSPVSTRVGMKSDCLVCLNRRVLIGFNDLATIRPDIAKEAFGWNPKEVTIGSSSAKLQWRCDKGHLYTSTVNSRIGNNSGCSICSNHKCLPGYNDLETTHPNLAIEAYGWDPTKIVAGTARRLKWKCINGHIWIATGNSRVAGSKSGCPSCAKFGFRPSDLGYIYFIENEAWNMFQIGITNSPDVRLNSHKKLGWQVLELRGPMDGFLAQQWERAILKMLKAKGADLSNSKIAGKFDGYSEAWSKPTFEVKSIKELMRLTEEFEESDLQLEKGS